MEYSDCDIPETIQKPKDDYEMTLENRIIIQIADSKIVIKSQQKYEPDFTLSERKDIVKDLLLKSPSQFLYRFGKFLKLEHLQYFEQFISNPEVYFYVKETQKLLNEENKRITLKNRRYGALKKMQTTSSYFTLEEMRKRDPLLYNELIDKNLTDTEKSERDNTSVDNAEARSSFSGLLFEQYERNRRNSKCRQQKEEEFDTIEEYDDDELEEEEEMESNNEPIADPKEKDLLKREFDSSIQFQFLYGKDPEFDYSAIDETDEFDLLDEKMQDDEEKYFDEEEEEIVDEVIDFGNLQISSNSIQKEKC